MRRDRPSQTAFKVAWAVLLVGEDPSLADLVPHELFETTRDVLVASGAFRPWHAWLTRSRRSRALLRSLERRTLPGMSLHVVLRKRFFEDEVRGAIASGARQVLILGAGYDTLALRLATEFSGVRFLELDHPTMHRRKRTALERLGRGSENLALAPVDLGRFELGATLAADSAWDPAARSAVVAEGLLMYLSETAVEALFAAVSARTGSGTLVAFSFTRPDERGRVYLGRAGALHRAGLRLIGEPMLWCTTRSALAAFLEQHGLDSIDEPGRVDLRERYLHPAGREAEPLTDIELVGVAKRG